RRASAMRALRIVDRLRDRECPVFELQRPLVARQHDVGGLVQQGAKPSISTLRDAAGYHTGFLAERAYLGEHSMQMGGGPGLGLNQEMICPRVGEDGKVTLRLDDHQVHVERLRRRPPYSPHY